MSFTTGHLWYIWKIPYMHKGLLGVKKWIVCTTFIVALCICVFVIVIFNYMYIFRHEMEYLESQSLIELQLTLDAEERGRIHFSLINNTEYQFMYGQQFILLVRNGERWRRVRFRGRTGDGNRIVFTSLGFSLYPKSYSEGIINLPFYFGYLPNGEYRIIKEVFQSGNPAESLKVVGRFTL